MEQERHTIYEILVPLNTISDIIYRALATSILSS